MRCKALKPTSDSRLQDFLGTLQSFEAYLRFQPALIFPLAASRQLRRALTIRYRDSSVDSNIPGTSLDQGVSSHFKILSAEIAIKGLDHVKGLDQWHGLMVWSRSWFRPAKLWSLPQIPGYRIFWVRCKALKPTPLYSGIYRAQRSR